MKNLVLLGGPTGVGKSTTLRGLDGKFKDGALLDADDVWRVGADISIPQNRDAAIGNVIKTMRGYLHAEQCAIAIVGWVFARPQLYQPVIDGLQDLVDSVQMIYLVCDPQKLEERLIRRGEPEKLDYALGRLQLIQALPFTRIDTSHLRHNEVVDTVYNEICTGTRVSL